MKIKTILSILNRNADKLNSLISNNLFDEIQKNYPEQIKLASIDDCATIEVEPECMTCDDTMYKALSITIPKHWVVVDIGCAYAAQAYYFKDHKKYIGIDLNPVGVCKDFKNLKEGIFRFTFDNTEHWVKNAVDLTKDDFKDLDLSQTFAIMNYNPLWTKTGTEDQSDKIKGIISLFQNVYCFFPSFNKENKN